jgi:hypothetical protein
MKKYDIILTDIDGLSPEKLESLCKSFSEEFSITLTGAMVMLQSLPTLLETDADEDKARQYMDFFEAKGGIIELKEKGGDFDPALPRIDDNPLTGLEDFSAISDFSLVNDESSLDKNKTEHDDFKLIDEELPETDDYSFLLEPKKQAPKPEARKNEVTPNKPPLKKAAKASEPLAMEKIDKKEAEVAGADYTCRTCGFNCDATMPECPICNTPIELQTVHLPEKVGEVKPEAVDKPEVEKKIKAPQKIQLKPSSPYKPWSKEFRTLLTETLFFTFLTSFGSLLLFIIGYQQDTRILVMLALAPLVLSLPIFLLGRIYGLLGTKGGVRSVGRLLLVFPSGIIATGNSRFFEERTFLFTGKYFALMNIFMIFLIGAMISAIFYSKQFHADKTKTSENVILQPSDNQNVASIKKVPAIPSNETKPVIEQAHKNETLKPTEASNQDAHQQTQQDSTHKTIPRQQEQTNQKENVEMAHNQMKKEDFALEGVIYSDRGKVDVALPKEEWLNAFKGRAVLVTLRNQSEFLGTLIGESNEHYMFEGYKYGGSFKFPIAKGDIREIRLLRKRS